MKSPTPSSSKVESISFAVMPSPIGDLLVVASQLGIVKIGFETESFDLALSRIADTFATTPQRDEGSLTPAIEQLDEYFAGNRRTFDVPLDHRLSTGFRREVQQSLTQIPYGDTASYQQVAIDVGHPRAARAVGTSCATNPLPLLLPCHRVVRADGSVGQYGGGTAAKVALLEIEQRGISA